MHRYVAPVLSQNKVGVVVVVIPSSCNKFWSQVSSAEALANALYSASVEERETDFCRADFQEIMLVPR